MRETSPCPCAVCGKSTIAFNYGVICCNACKQFYKRMRESNNVPKNCRLGGNCSKCRYCRFQMCLTAGLTPPSPPSNLMITPKESTPPLSAVLQHLQYLDIQRQDTFLNFTASSDFSLDDLILADSLCYTRKAKDFKANFSHWTTLILSTSVDLIKRFELTRALSKSEKMDFVKSSFRTHATFCIAMHSYSNQKESTEFPGGFDTLPSELAEHYQNFPAVLNNIRCALVAKLRELNVTNEEFLLLSAILISSPVGPIFSKSTQGNIARYQQLFSSCLMQYCMQNYHLHGPTRFSDLLSIFRSITRTLEDFDSAVISMQCSQPKVKIEKVFIDLIN